MKKLTGVLIALTIIGGCVTTTPNADDNYTICDDGNTSCNNVVNVILCDDINETC